MPSNPVGSGTPTGTLSYAQLKAVWLNASLGTRYHSNAWASLMAAIAEAESAGDVLATNPNDNNGTQTSWGLWQISNGTHNAPGPNWADPEGNAKLAIDKLNTQGLRAWGTYDSGAYKPYLSDKTAPDYNPGGVSAVVQGQVTASAEGEKSCAWSIGWGGISGTSWLSWLGIGGGGNIGSGEICLLSKVQLRMILGVALLGAGLVAAEIGVNWILKAAVAGQIASKLGPALSALGPEGAAVGAAAEAGAPKPKPARTAAPSTTTAEQVQPRRRAIESSGRRPKVIQGEVISSSTA